MTSAYEIAQLMYAWKEERDAAWEELRDIRNTIGADESEATSDEVRRLFNKVTAERDEARRGLGRIKEILAVGRNVGEDKEQAYQDAEEIADIAINGGAS